MIWAAWYVTLAPVKVHTTMHKPPVMVWSMTGTATLNQQPTAANDLPVGELRHKLAAKAKQLQRRLADTPAFFQAALFSRNE